MEIYLDNSATTQICKAAADKIIYIVNNIYGNPSSLHNKGLDAQHEVEAARKTLAKALGTLDTEIYFTSGGTETNNTAVFGAAYAKKRQGNKIVTTGAEHSSVFEACKELEKQGFEVVYLQPDISGHITAEQIENAVDKNTILVSVMNVNNETGAIFPVDKIKKIIDRKKAPALFHCDAVQAFGKIPVKPYKIGADLLTVSSHKIHGPKGCGALFVRKGVYIKPLLYGGEQQRKIRPGTEAVPLIAGFGEAVSQISPYSQTLESMTALRDYTVKRLSQIGGIVINSPEDALPYIVNISVTGIKSETLLHFLEEREIYVSSGSACAKGKQSHVLTSMGLPKNITDSALRISFSKFSTTQDADALANAIEQASRSLIRNS